jgi:CRP/FNR family cyclic AMP-dependent transcriptional regulator
MPDLADRFVGEQGRPRLVAALRQNRIVYEDSFAEELAAILHIAVVSSGTNLIRQGGSDDDLFFILAGRVSINVKEREMAIRDAGRHVGEMSLLDPAARRSATVTALEETVVGRVSEAEFTRLGHKYPECWRLIAKDLADRLRQRNRFVMQPNPRPILFVGSSTESSTIARTIGRLFEHDDIVVRVWTDRDIFGASTFPIEALEDLVRTSDFAVIVMTPDDTTVSRGVQQGSPRDNAVFELGLFMGSLSRKRTFLAVPQGADIKIPSDLLGLTQLRYPPLLAQGDLAGSLSPLCDDLRRIIVGLGTK